MLAMTRYDGPEDEPTCLIAHGLYGSARNWGVIAKRLSETRPVVAVDMRNHGQSHWTETHSYEELGADLAEIAEALGTPVDVVGHSMGGKAAMMMASQAPATVRRLIIADIAPVTYTHSQLPMIEAMRKVDLSHVTRRSEAAAQLGAFGIEPALQSFFTQSLDVANKTWRYNLDTLEREMPKIMSFPEVTGTFAEPTLFLTGALSDYVLPEHRPDIRRLFPKARFAKLPKAGHWLHADNPRAFQASVDVFLSSASG